MALCDTDESEKFLGKAAEKFKAAKTFTDYMQEGPLAALDAIEQATGEREANVIGYCLGGTLLASRAKPLTETEISSLPAEHVFHLMIEQCTACHAKFRTADK